MNRPKYKELYLEEKDKREELETKEDIVHQIKQEHKTQKLSSEMSKLKKKYKHILNENDNLKDRINTIIEVQETPYKSKDIEIQLSSKEQVAVLVASDWHLEEYVDPETVNGINSYNLEESKKRAENFFHNSIKRIDEINNGNTKQVILALLGDFISGYIHEELMENNKLSPTEAIIFVKSIIRNGIDALLERDFELTIPCNFGNHGRTGQLKKASTGYKNNFEWLMYKLLEQDYKDTKGVTFQVANGYFNYVDVYDKVIRFHHGDNMNYSGGIGGPTIPINKAIDRFNKGKFANLDVFGHFHQTFSDKRFVGNGSLIGTTPYSMKFGNERPSQTLFFMDKKYGKTTHEPIFVNERY